MLQPAAYCSTAAEAEGRCKKLQHKTGCLTVLALEAAAVLVGHDVAHLLHQVGEALHLLLGPVCFYCAWLCVLGEGVNVQGQEAVSCIRLLECCTSSLVLCMGM